jgi:capsular exopolysaccharide synthesis family protein
MRDHEFDAKGFDPVASEVAQIRLAHGTGIKLPKNGGQPIVVAGGDFMAPAIEAYKSLRTRVMRAQASRGIRSVAVTSAAPSEGKTLTTLNLACCCAQLENTPVLLIDADLRTRGLTALIGNLPAVGLANVLSGTASREEAISKTDMPNLYVMGAGKSDTPPTELFSADKWLQFMEWATASFKLVLMDSLPVGTVTDYDLIEAGCDGVLMVVRALSARRQALESALEQVDPKKMLGVVWNGANRSERDYTYGAR